MIYRLDHDLDHISEEGVYDATLIRFPGEEDAWFSNPELDLTGQVPQPMEFVGNLAALEQTDYPYLDRSFPLMSWKLLMTLLSVEAFPYRVYPTRIYSEALRDEVRYESGGMRTDLEVTDPSLYTDRFVVVQPSEWTDVLDTQRTIYAARTEGGYVPRRAADTESKWGFVDDEKIEHLVLTAPEKGLPGLFLIPQLASLLCTERSVAACRQAGIVGVSFTPIPVPLYSGARAVPGGYRLLAEENLSVELT